MQVASRVGEDEYARGAHLEGVEWNAGARNGERCGVPGSGRRLARAEVQPRLQGELAGERRPPSGVASAGFALRAQTEGDLEAARWGLLAWEDPRERSKFKPFWMDGKMLEAEVVEPGESVDPVDPVGMMVRATGMSVSGLLLLGGALVLKVKRGRRMEQIRVLEGERFDLERSGLQLQFGFDGHPSSVLPRLWNLAAIMKLRKGVALGVRTA